MTYTPTTWVNGTTPASAANMNNIETGIAALDTAINTSGNSNTLGTFNFSLNGSNINVITCANAHGIGIKIGSVKAAEFGINGDFVIGGSNLKTTSGSAFGFSTGGGFDTFDYAEMFPSFEVYAAGTVLIPQGELLEICNEDASPFAMIVSEKGGMVLGGNIEDETVIAVPIALTGRVRVSTSEDIQSRQWVTSTSDGKVRAIKKGETAFTLGYALHPTHDGKVGVFLRPCMMTVKP